MSLDHFAAAKVEHFYKNIRPMIHFSKLNPKWARYFLKLFYLLIVTSVLYFFTRQWSYDDPYITYRYAKNILNGIGFVYNPGELVLSTTTPLLALLLASLNWLWPNLPQLAILIGSASLAAGGLILFQLAMDQHTPFIGWFCLLLYPIFPLTIITLGSETPLYLVLILGTILTYQNKQYLWTGLIAGLAVLARPDGVLLPILLAFDFLFTTRRPVPWKAIFLFAGVNLAWFGFAWLYFGSPLPVTLAAKQHQGAMEISERFLPGFITTIKWYASSWGYQIAAILAVIGVLYVVKFRRWFLVLVWTVTYFTAYSILGVSRYYWYYAPLVPGFVVLAGAGLNFLWEQRILITRHWVIALAGFVLVLFSAVSLTQLRDLWRFRNNQDERIPVYTEVGNWLYWHTPSDASVGALEVGAIGYFSNRRMIDFAGLIQPDVASQLTQATTYEDAAIYAVEHYFPDYVVLNIGIFPKLREDLLTSRCQSLESFQNGNVAVELFKCRWK